MSADEYRRLLDTDFSDVELEELTDISTLRIDMSLPLEERMEKYLKDIHNPYYFRNKRMRIKVGFANNGVTFEEAFENMLLSV